MPARNGRRDAAGAPSKDAIVQSAIHAPTFPCNVSARPKPRGSNVNNLAGGEV